ncbi:MAG: hypothetical protein R3175_07530 [Marinobacter sp.]|uniref:phage head spike fiber domain-containing protein n=1 Tax=Marinobacter sp. TaxID=50741 RepID=UPI00299D4BAB|nr:hypothetical protein [Marinobacter sp.]MDX1755891.1 hypothetical protein [Marinobacter sp.]
MAAPEITQLPPAPSRADDGETFSSKADAFVAALEPFRQEANTSADFMDTKAAEADTSAANAATSEANAATSEANAATSEANAAASEDGVAASAAAAATSEANATAQANTATTKASEAATSASDAATSAAEALQHKNDAAAVVTGGTATFDPEPGKIPLADSTGQISEGWLGDTLPNLNREQDRQGSMLLAMDDHVKSAQELQALALFEGGTDEVFVSGDYAEDIQSAADVTANYGETVAMVADKSGAGNDGAQASSSLKPVRGRMPVGGVRNLVSYSEQLDQNYWSKTGSPTVTPNAALAPNGEVVADHWQRTTTSASYSGGLVNKPAVVDTYTYSVHLKKDVGDYAALRIQGQYPARVDATIDLDSVTIFASAAFSGFTLLDAGVFPMGDGWYRCYLTFTTDSYSTLTGHISFNSNGEDVDGPDSAADSAGYWFGAQIEKGGLTPYQRVGTFLDTTEAGVPSIEYLRFDHVDDKLTHALPNGVVDGTLLVAGTNGSWISEGVTVGAGGDLEIGPRDMPGQYGAFGAVGDVVGWMYLDRMLTRSERRFALDYYKQRGAQGHLIRNGVEHVTNGTFEDLTGWTAQDCDIVVENGRLKISMHSTTTAFVRIPISGLVKGDWVNIRSVSSITNGVGIRTGLNNGARNTGADNVSSSSDTTRDRFVELGGTPNSLEVIVNGDAATVAYIDDISIQKLTTEEELA